MNDSEHLPRDGNQDRRSYESPLRAQQLEGTRNRILEALVRTMASGLATLSMPAVAREANVSIPTVYRHFGSKAGLIEALGPYVVAKAGLIPERIPKNFDEIETSVRTLYRHLQEMNDTLRAAMASQLGQELRRAGMPLRRSYHQQFLRSVAPDLPAEDLERLTDLSVVLISSGTFRAYKDYLDLDTDAAADRTSWAIHALVRGARAALHDRKETSP